VVCLPEENLRLGSTEKQLNQLNILRGICLAFLSLKYAKVQLISLSLFPVAMLEYWFNPQISILKKLLIFIVIAAVTAGLYWMEPLPLDSILMFAGTGIIFLICRYCKIHFVKNPTGLSYRLLTWIPIALLLALIFMNMKDGEILVTGAQGIGFMALSICLFSPLSLMHKNSHA